MLQEEPAGAAGGTGRRCRRNRQELQEEPAGAEQLHHLMIDSMDHWNVNI